MVKFQAAQAALNMLRLDPDRRDRRVSGIDALCSSRIDLDDVARRAVGAEQRTPRQGARHGLVGVEMDSIRLHHVTLVFLAEVTEAVSASVVERMTPDIDAAPFDVVFQHLGVFPLRGAPQALWLGVAEGARELGALGQLVRRRLKPLGAPLEERRSPHT